VLRGCKDCRVSISTTAKSCPHCGATQTDAHEAGATLFAVVIVIAGCGWWSFSTHSADAARNQRLQEMNNDAHTATAAVNNYYQLGYAEAGSWGRWKVARVVADVGAFARNIDVVVDLSDSDAEDIMRRSSGAQAAAVSSACPSRYAKAPLTLPAEFSVIIQPRYRGTIFDNVKCQRL
jgi:hypothetical protein